MTALRSSARAVRQNLLLIAAVVVGAMLVSFVVSLLTTSVYESRAEVIVADAVDEGEAQAGGDLAERRAATYVQVVTSQLLAERVLEELADDADGAAGEVPDDAGDLADQVRAGVVADSSVLEIVVRAEDPLAAQLLAQTYATELVETAADIEAPAGADVPPTTFTILDQASFEPDAVAPDVVRNLLLGLAAGLLLGLAFVVVRDRLDTSIASREDLREVTDVAVVGAIGLEPAAERRRFVTDLEHAAPRVEAFRVLRTNVQFLDVGSEHKLVVVTSTSPDEGKTSTSVDLALTLARAGSRTLLIDGDLRRPRLASIFGIEGDAGVTTALLGKVDLTEAVWRHESTGLDVLPSGVVPPNAAELLQTPAMTSLLDHLRSAYDVVVVDAPPLLPVTDAAVLAARADASLLVVRHGRTQRTQVAMAVERLEQVDVRLAGIVINRVPVTGRGPGRYVYGYGGYGGYGSTPA